MQDRRTLPAGTLPDYSSLRQLVTLELQSNALTGDLPERLPPGIKSLRLNSNQFQGMHICTYHSTI